MLSQPRNSDWQRFDWYLLLGLVVLNFIVKFIYIDFPDIGGDEPFSMFYANADLDTYLAIIHTENNPPLYLLLLKVWIKLFGMSPISVRMMSLIFSAATAGLIYKLGRRYFSTHIGLITALLFTFASYHMEFAHQARVYSLFGLLTMLSMYSYLRWIFDDVKKHSALLVVFNVLLIYSHFFGFFVIMIQFICTIIIKEIRIVKLKSLIIGWLITALLYAPFIGLTIYRFTDSASGTWQGKVQFTDLYNNLWNFSNQPVNTVIFLLILLAGAIFYFMRAKGLAISPRNKVILIWFLVPYLLMFFISFYIPMFLYRYLIFLSFAYYFLIAISLSFILRSKMLLNGISGALVVMMIFTCNFKAGNDRPDRMIVEKIKASNGENTSVIICPYWHFLLFSYHYDIQLFKDFKHVHERLEKESVFSVYSLSPYVKDQINLSDTVIFVDAWASLVDPEMTIKSYLNSNFKQIGAPDEYDGTVITYYLSNTEDKKRSE